MRFNISILACILTITISFAGCAGTETPTGSGNGTRANTNSNTTAANSNNPLGTTRAPESATGNNAPTLAPIVQGYYAALQKKDEAGAKKFLSAAALKYWEAEMKSEKNLSLLAILEENAFPVEEKRDVRNEKIEGETAVAEIKGASVPSWTPTKFVKENGEWKFASPKESFIELQNIPKSDPNSNAGK